MPWFFSIGFFILGQIDLIFYYYYGGTPAPWSRYHTILTLVNNSEKDRILNVLGWHANINSSDKSNANINSSDKRNANINCFDKSNGKTEESGFVIIATICFMLAHIQGGTSEEKIVVSGICAHLIYYGFVHVCVIK